MTPTYPPLPKASTDKPMTLLQMLKLIETETNATQTASEKFKATCEKLGFLTKDSF